MGRRGWFLIVLGRFGVVVGRCGSFWIVLVHFGSFWIVPCFSNYVLMLLRDVTLAVMSRLRQIQENNRVTPSLLLVIVGFCRGSSVEGKMSSVEGKMSRVEAKMSRAKKSWGFYLKTLKTVPATHCANRELLTLSCFRACSWKLGYRATSSKA